MDFYGNSMEMEDTLKDQYLTFSIGKEVYGLEIRYVTEIVGLYKITEVPEMPDYIKGVINLRGQIIPVMDIRVRFRKEAKEYDERTCIVILDIRDFTVGLIVDQVLEVVTIPQEDIVPPPQVHMGQGYQGRFVQGIGKVGDEVKLILDCERVLTDEEADNLQNIIAE